MLVIDPGFVTDGGHQIGQNLFGRFALGAPFHAVDELAEFGQGRQLPGLDAVLNALLEHGRKQGNVSFAGVMAQYLQRALPNAPTRRGRRPNEGRVVVLIGQQAQVGRDVADLRLVKKGLPAGELVRHLVVAQLFLKNTCLMVAAIQNGVIGPASTALKFMGL